MLMEISATNTDKFKVIKLVGKIMWDDAQELDRRIRHIVEDEGFCHLVFNMDEVSFICSGGIGVLVYNLKKVREKDGGIYIVSANEYFNYICETLKFDVIFNGCLFKKFEDFCEGVLDKSVK
ncbi:MAG: STAS domain-containing protein [Chitinivibrionales bacterium]|nr:STAS domain-containing protein [Chitinivibrionales bacterium]MBD3358852.1 STAS domain-containing protein [Chitinivibrionales bacterium]